MPWLAAGWAGLATAAEDDAAVEKRLADAVRYLASDELEGRGVGTKGIDLAADYIARQFAQCGLKTDLSDGTPFQYLSPISLTEFGRDNEPALVGPLKANGDGPETIEKLEEQIDQGPKPHSSEPAGRLAIGRTDVKRRLARTKNVLAVLEGEGPTAEETILVGAHYDHLGRGGPGSTLGRIVRSLLAMEPQQPAIHNGADDNASGVAVLIELARELANRPKKLRRRVLFIAFAGEERGLLGSAHYVSHPLIPLEKTLAMLNLDMVGRLRGDNLIVSGTGTATNFDALLERINQRHDLKLTREPSVFGLSDHASFYAKKIPALHFFTGVHSDLHRPSDDFETLDISGMRRVDRFVSDVIVALANAEDRPEYVSAASPRRRSGGPRPFLGVVAESGAEGPGYVLSSVVEGGPAQRAGLAAGDVIVEFGESKIGSAADIERALRKHKAGDRVRVVVRRGEESLTFEVTLDPPR